MKTENLQAVQAAIAEFEKDGATSVSENHVLGLITGGVKIRIRGMDAGQLNAATTYKFSDGRSSRNEKIPAVAYWPDSSVDALMATDIALAVRDHFSPKGIPVILIPQPGVECVLPYSVQDTQDRLRIAHMYAEMRDVRVDSFGEHMDLREWAASQTCSYAPNVSFKRDGQTIVRENGPSLGNMGMVLERDRISRMPVYTNR